MNRILKILPFLLLCAFVLQVMPVGAQQQMFLSRTQEAAPPPSAGLLDPDYKGSAFAAAIDVLLYGSYTATDDIPGSQTFGQQGQWSVAVLRDFDDAIKSFTPSQVADGTANTWVQALGPSDGFVRRWYDQSVTAQDVSNLNHGDQSDPTKMPKLFDSSTGLILENGKAAMEFDGVNDVVFTQNIDFSNTSNVSYFISVKKLSDSSLGMILEFTPNGDSFSGAFFLTGPRLNNTDTYGVRSKGTTLAEITVNGYAAPSRNLVSVINSISPRIIELYIDGIFQDQNTANQGTGNYSNQPIFIGARGPNSVIPAEVNVETVVVFPSDQSTNRPGIETAINNEYNIYP